MGLLIFLFVAKDKKKAEEKMGKALDTLRKEFVSLRTGRASLGIIASLRPASPRTHP